MCRNACNLDLKRPNLSRSREPDYSDVNPMIKFIALLFRNQRSFNETEYVHVKYREKWYNITVTDLA